MSSFFIRLIPLGISRTHAKTALPWNFLQRHKASKQGQHLRLFNSVVPVTKVALRAPVHAVPKRTAVASRWQEFPMDSDSEGAARSAPRPSPLQAHEQMQHDEAHRYNSSSSLSVCSIYVASAGTSKAVA